MALAFGELLRWGEEFTHYDNRYFLRSTDYGFQVSREIDVAIEHDTMSPFRFTHRATIIRAADGVALLHVLDEERPEERHFVERIKAGLIFLSPGVQALGRNNHRTLGLPHTHYTSPTPIKRFEILEASYCVKAGQPYLRPVRLIL